MTGQVVPIVCGTGMIAMLRDQSLSWVQMMSEWIDNSFGANARNVTIRKTRSLLEIIDDGDGTDDLPMMESLARSNVNPGNKASKYGIGGVMSQIKASRGGTVEVKSVTRTTASEIIINWQECIDQNELKAVFNNDTVLTRKQKPGTTITIHNCMQIKKPEQLIRELGHRYSVELRRGRTIIFDLNGQITKVKPYKHPPFDREIRLDFEVNGHHITGFCGMVNRRHSNPFPGWSVHWGYRFVGRFNEPAGDKAAHRIYAEVVLPDSWRNISVTKDSFNDDDDADLLWAELEERCREIVEAADTEVQDVELSSATRAAEEILGLALGGQGGVKGARPGDAGKEGTVKPTGRGGRHRNFTATQPGDAAEAENPLPARTPDRVRIVWDDTIDGAYQIQTSGTRGRTFILTLNASFEPIARFKAHPDLLATYCLTFVAREIAEGKDQVCKLFPSFRDADFKEVYQHLLGRLSPSRPSQDHAA